MKVTIIGTGYVGLVTGTCLAELGHQVICVDRHQDKIDLLSSGKSHIYEPGLEALIKKNIRAKRLSFTIDIGAAVKQRDVIVIAVGTPPKADGSADLQHVFTATKSIAQKLTGKPIIMNKSTVPVGTAAKVADMVRRESGRHIDIVSCPEFLREGFAVQDFFNPDRVVIGSTSALARQKAKRLFQKVKTTFILTDPYTSETIKYASNAFLATKISFINEIANVCAEVGADVMEVSRGMGADNRIGKSFLHPGIGYGGSCFPKDVRALKQIAGGAGYDFKLLSAVIEVNQEQRIRFYRKIKKTMGSVAGKHIAVLGLAFKGNTDDVRESAALDLVRWLVKDGAKVVVFDPKAMERAKLELPKQVMYAPSATACAKGAAAVVIATEWKEFTRLPWARIIASMKGSKYIFDGKNALVERLSDYPKYYRV